MVNWTPCCVMQVHCIFNMAGFIYTTLLIGQHISHTHQTRKNVPQSPLYTVLMKHVIQPVNHSTTMHTVFRLNVPQVTSLSVSLLCSDLLSVSVSWVYKEQQVCACAWLRAGLSYIHVDQRGRSGQDEALLSHKIWQCCTSTQGCVEVRLRIFVLSSVTAM